MNMIDHLIKKKISFLVCCADFKMKMVHTDRVGKDYFIACATKDILNPTFFDVHEKLLKYHHYIIRGFHVSKENRNVVEYTLQNFEVKKFKEQEKLFIKVSQNKQGKIYELTENQFKDNYNKKKIQ